MTPDTPSSRVNQALFHTDLVWPLLALSNALRLIHKRCWQREKLGGVPCFGCISCTKKSLNKARVCGPDHQSCMKGAMQAALRMSRQADLDPTQVHGIVTATVSYIEATRQSLYLVPMPPEGSLYPTQPRHALHHTPSTHATLESQP